MKVSHKGDGIPEIWSAEELEAGDGVLLEIPMRYGCMAAQMKAVRRPARSSSIDRRPHRRSSSSLSCRHPLLVNTFGGTSNSSWKLAAPDET
ncbi:hypothetical protein RHGRI_010137 [Rhododendron griersonianum]|uniref:Uncharacterized protein n=1 Tax=Rhododendron griersonianum TaxID=479676 RepID=A0AAV6KHA1_9ERIC|nr:hypothetical protein RHGRI_010137 [Rhododendron griersonianum]